MKSSSLKASIIALGSSLLLSAALGGESSNVDSSVVATVRGAIASLKLAEVPNQAARWVRESDTTQRAAVTRAAVEAAVGKYPTAVYATVKAVLAVDPSQVSAVMEGVIAAAPKQVKTALRAVAENEDASITAALNVVGQMAPAQLATAQAVAAKRQGNARPAAGPFDAVVVVTQQTTVSGTPPPERTSNDYPN